MGNTRRFRVTRQAGFTMVETLVALVVLAIGLLGIAALYLDSLRAGRTAIYRTQAVSLAADLADRIRVNRDAGLAYEIALAGTATAKANCTTTTGCNAADMAGTDLSDWKARVAQQLPEGDGSVDVTVGVGGEPSSYVITVSWTEVGMDTPLTYQLGVES
jgi:type IV pilus assembly protein PilV